MKTEKISQMMTSLLQLRELTKEEKTMLEELFCRQMIMSCLAYNTNIYTSEYVLKYQKTLGRDRFLRVCKEQKEYFENHCRIVHNVYVDTDGLSYNSIIEN